jgi:hypothetical protein
MNVQYRTFLLLLLGEVGYSVLYCKIIDAIMSSLICYFAFLSAEAPTHFWICGFITKLFWSSPHWETTPTTTSSVNYSISTKQAREKQAGVWQRQLFTPDSVVQRMEEQFLIEVRSTAVILLWHHSSRMKRAKYAINYSTDDTCPQRFSYSEKVQGHQYYFSINRLPHMFWPQLNTPFACLHIRFVAQQE